MKSAEMVKKIRLTLYLSRREFAELLGLTSQAIYQYETGLRKPQISSIGKILEFAKKKKIKASIEDFID